VGVPLLAVEEVADDEAGAELFAGVAEEGVDGPGGADAGEFFGEAAMVGGGAVASGG